MKKAFFIFFMLVMGLQSGFAQKANNDFVPANEAKTILETEILNLESTLSSLEASNDVQALKEAEDKITFYGAIHDNLELGSAVQPSLDLAYQNIFSAQYAGTSAAAEEVVLVATNQNDFYQAAVDLLTD